MSEAAQTPADLQKQLQALRQSIAALQASGVVEGVLEPLRAQAEGIERQISTQGGAYFEGQVSTGGGDVIGGSQYNLIIGQQAERWLRSLGPRLSSQLSEQDLQQATQAYLQALYDRHCYLSMKGMGVSDRIPLRLPLLNLYVPLKARPELPEGETWRRELRLAGRELEAGEEGALRLGEPQPVLELLKNFAGLVVLGDPGSGKTTFLKFLALKLATGEGGSLGLGERLPILVPLSAYATALQQSEQRLDDFIAAYSHEKGSDLPVAELLAEALRSGSALILLDGLDEVKTLGLRHTVVERVIDFYSFQRRQGNKFVLTSRVVGYKSVRPVAEDLTECTLVDFEQEEIEQFIGLWTQAVEAQAQLNPAIARQEAEKERRELLDSIQNNAGVRRLAANPLLLTILALMKRQGVTLPERRVQLYDQYVETLLSTWNRARSLSGRALTSDLDVIQTTRTLAALALWMHESSPGAGLVRREDLRRKLVEMYAESGEAQPESAARQFLEDVREHAALLLERGPGEYGFIHLTFEEYLAAVALALRGQGDAAWISAYLGQRVGEQAWREVSLLTVSYLGIRQQLPKVAGAVVEKLVEGQPGPPGEAAVLAGEAVLDALPGGVPNESKVRVVQALVPTMQSPGVPGSLRRRAGLLLGRLGWQPDDLESFVKVQAGKFLYGDAKEPRELPYDFWVAKYPLTNLQYARFIAEGGYQRQELWSPEGWEWRSGIYDSQATEEWEKNWLSRRPPERRSLPFSWEDPNFNNPLFPVVGVSWFEAQAYCNWLALQELPFEIPDGYTPRLPSEAEWERAARGVDGRMYPWGEQFDFANANVAEKFGEGMLTSAVCTYPGGASPDGAWDMSGNVWEWTGSWYDREQKYRVLRGGSWVRYQGIARCAYRVRYVPDLFDDYIGFRVVVSLADAGF